MQVSSCGTPIRPYRSRYQPEILCSSTTGGTQRDLVRSRRKLVQSQAAERNRLLKVLEDSNIKLASVATDVFGLSGRLMLRALIEGRATPQEMAALAKGRLRNKITQLELALEG